MIADASPTLSLGDAARRLDVTPATVRKWTIRYGLESTRTQGGHRRFSAATIEHLRCALQRGLSRSAAVAEAMSATAVVTCCPRCGEAIDRVTVRFRGSVVNGEPTYRERA